MSSVPLIKLREYEKKPSDEHEDYTLETKRDQELWQELDRLSSKHQIDWKWVRGHTGHVGNERADQLANNAIDELVL